MRTIDQIVEDFAREAKVDYVGLWQIANAVATEFQLTEALEVRRLSIIVISRLLNLRLQAVDLATSGGGCQPWESQDHNYIIERIASEWDKLGHEPDIGDVVWFNAPR